MNRAWQRVVFAHECEPCVECGEPVCPACVEHYCDCDCPGPTSDGYEFRTGLNGILMAKPRATIKESL